MHTSLICATKVFEVSCSSSPFQNSGVRGLRLNVKYTLFNVAGFNHQKTSGMCDAPTPL